MVLRRWITSVTGLVLLLAMVGCTDAPAPGATETPTSIEPSMRYRTQEVVWERCGAAECATVNAPLDWDDVDAGSIELALVRHRAEVENPIGTLFYNPGGPGISGVDAVSSGLSGLFSIDVRRQFDIVGFDVRGVGRSTPVECDAKAEKRKLTFGPWSARRGTQEYREEVLAAASAFAARCEEHSGKLHHYLGLDQPPTSFGPHSGQTRLSQVPRRQPKV